MSLLWPQANGLNAGLSFWLPLDDAGGGAVNTTPAYAAGSQVATFTRATVAWTKLASGLWTQVASGTARSCYLGADTTVGAYGGFFAEDAGTQLVTPTASIRDMTNGAWTPTNITPVKTATGIDGAANSATTLTATAGNGTILQTLAAAASSRTYSCWIKRRTGTGTINITQNGGTNWTDITSQINASTYTRVSLTASILNASFGIQIVTNTDAIDVDFNQFEAGAFATSPMASAGAARNSDMLSYVVSGNASASTGTYYAELCAFPEAGTNTTLEAFSAPVQNRQLGRLLSTTSVSFSDGTNTTIKSGLSSLPANTIRKVAFSFSGSALNITADGAVVASGSYSGDAFGGQASFTIAPKAGNGSLGGSGVMRNARIYSIVINAAQLQSMTT